MKVKTAYLIGPALDWAVAKCLGVTPVAVKKKHSDDWLLYSHPSATVPLEYSSRWSQGGPSIEREGIKVGIIDDDPPVIWAAQLSDPWRKRESVYSHTGPTPLIAACRCLVASRLGDEVDIPEELLK